MKDTSQYAFLPVVAAAMMTISAMGCDDIYDDRILAANSAYGDNGGRSQGSGSDSPSDIREAAILLVIDEESIDNGNEPNGFSDVDVNDQMAELGVRDQLRYFRNNVGRTVDLYTGEVGDEGWHALKTIPGSWRSAGPTDNGAMNYILAGPGLGSPDRDDDREAYLDKIPHVTPLRAAGLTMLIGQTVLAVVYDSDVSINYSPLNGSLKGASLGLVALRVVDVRERRDGSTGSLPRVTVEILDSDEIRAWPLYLFSNAPVPRSSSEPYDTVPPGAVDAPVLIPAP